MDPWTYNLFAGFSALDDLPARLNVLRYVRRGKSLHIND
jgi:hypothetical protein